LNLVLKILLFNAFEESDRDVCQFCTNWSNNRCFTTHFNHSLLLTFSVLSGKQAKFSNVFHRLSRNLNENGDTNLNWVYFIRTILNECGFTYMWETENVNNKEWLKCVVT
jgi:hypothetical protein